MAVRARVRVGATVRGGKVRARVRVRVRDAPGTCSPAAHEVASGPNVKMLPVSVITWVPVRLMHLVKG